MPSKGKKRSVRLSFIGGRRSSRLPPVKVHKKDDSQTEKHIDIEEKENSFLQSSSLIKRAVPQCANTTKPLVDDLEPSVNLHQTELTEDKKQDETLHGESKKLKNLSQTVDINTEKTAVKRKKQRRSGENRKTQRKEKEFQEDLKKLEELKLSLNLEEKIRRNEEYQERISKEIEEWKNLQADEQQQLFLGPLDNIDIADDVKELLSVETMTDCNDLQKLIDKERRQMEQIRNKEIKLQFLKEIARNRLISKQNELQGFEVNSESPRHLIKTIIKKYDEY